MLELFKQVTKGTTKYSEEYWNKLRDFVYDEENNSGDFIISYLSRVNKGNVINDNTRLIISILQSMYPFKGEQINQLTKSIANCISKLNQIQEKDSVSIRGYLLYRLMDTIFHNPELICDVSEDAKHSLFESILKMSDLKYDVNIPDGESYFKNYTVIQFINYFNDSENKIRLIDKYLNHLDSRVRDDMIFEINEYDTFEYYKKRKK